jgi:feruloyl-CoA synthase
LQAQAIIQSEPYLHVDTIHIDIVKEVQHNGNILLYSTQQLQPCSYRLTERLLHWATVAPGKVFIAKKDNAGIWQTLTYAQTLKKVLCIASALLKKNVSAEKPIAILSENSLEHALIALAAMHIGIPYSSIAPAYSLRSTDYSKLKHVITLLTPGLIFVQDGIQYVAALQAVAGDADIVAAENIPAGISATLLNDLAETEISDAVEKAYHSIQPQTVAKILFTSGSTGLPKGVINTHENISTNWQQITQTFPFLKEEGLEFIDWLPWNHTFGGNHNFGLTLFNGGSLYIDEGNPTPHGIRTTVANLRERNPVVYFNVPKGFEELIPFLNADETLRKQFFSRLKMIFYAGAGMPQHVWDALEQLSVQTIGKKILIGTGLGCTEACPSALFASEPGGHAGLLGVPVPGLILKLVATNGKMEARYKGKNIFPGYWRQPELTAKVFDEEGFYCTGDALKFVDDRNVNKGMVFDGRIAEDFKLNTGTWVSVGVLRAKLIAAGNGLIQDVVITGHDKDYIGAIVFAELNYCKNNFAIEKNATLKDISNNHKILQALQNVLQQLAQTGTGSSTLVKRAVLANFNLSIDKGEITDKGTVNQRMVIQNNAELIETLYSKELRKSVAEINFADKT